MEKSPEDLFGPTAVERVDQILSGPPPRHHERILELTEQEIQSGFSAPLVDRHQIDRQFGVGNWSCIPRFLVQQHAGKDRLIDNGARGGHSDASSFEETIYTESVDFIPTAVRGLWSAAKPSGAPLPEEEHLLPTFGLDDLPDAFRACPLSRESQRAAVVVVYDHRKSQWAVSVMKGAPYGVGSVVLTFNRLPALAIAATRRIFGVAATAYFDDIATVDLQWGQGTAQAATRTVLKGVGAPPKATKSLGMACVRPFLGTTVNLSHSLETSTAVITANATMRASVADELETAAQQGQLEPHRASKLMGKTGWLATNSSGRLGRLGTAVLKSVQYRQNADLSECDCFALRAHASIVRTVPPRVVDLIPSDRPRATIYTDASWEPESEVPPRLGWVIFIRGERPLAGTMVIPPELVTTWKPRTQQIYPAEALAVPTVLLHYQDQLRGKELIWFIDNEAACASMIKGSSREQEVDALATLAHLLSFRLEAPVWYEWIDSASNPADGLSRDGLKDEWTLKQGWSLAEIPYPHDLLFASPTEVLERFHLDVG